MARTGKTRIVMPAIGFVTCLLLLLLLLQFGNTQAAEYVVGDKQGWDLYPELVHWPEGKHFAAGDVLIFNYSSEAYAVEAVDQSQYQQCTANGHPKKLYSSGHDRVALEKGPNYFICRDINYCGYGIKIEVHAQ